MMNIEYRGWIDIRLSENQHEFTIEGSFLSDVIHDIANRISTLTEGANEVIIRVQAEPGEYRILIINSGDNCLVEVYGFDNNFSSDDLTQGNIVFRASIEMSLLLKRFYNEITKLKELGEKEYHRIWGYEFPSEAYQRLKKAVVKHPK
ncbi:hypothetical protein GC098_04545 [Paenibacillus sp. LMG 31458]|uniref:Uncharacterized protein n=1 Tax=Paenibacillus phytorum TaxID=2654977 RepID=A0ABX1XQ91_9BACL|nr:hypothetical protein [Paenibacillus phytorum]NOU70705.1 hypothetical protein [Paenibacillus phytorum]